MNRTGVSGQTPSVEGVSQILGDGEQAHGGDEAAISPVPDHDEDGNAQSSNNATATAKKRKRQLTRNACIKCRLAKAKCDGKHPTCYRCSVSGSECIYDVPSEGITKMQSLQQRLELKTSELQAKTSELQTATTVLTCMQHGTDSQATEVFARLRRGESIESVAVGLSVQPLYAVPDMSFGPGKHDSFATENASSQTWPDPLDLASPLSAGPQSECFLTSIPHDGFQNHYGAVDGFQPDSPPSTFTYPPFGGNSDRSRSLTLPTEGASLQRMIPQISFGAPTSTLPPSSRPAPEPPQAHRRPSAGSTISEPKRPASVLARPQQTLSTTGEAPPPIYEGVWPLPPSTRRQSSTPGRVQHQHPDFQH
ncbi:hypothetical protein KC332_g15127 [Hortaea werneckii]|uniref:Zn(2)-C6 fungal-type domain-containing protein n=2 Tax=Hortaea werneckii TaxID=91943 RepID=A0A3M7I326_HORWE|nr:hypothetical protein KC358_g15156 [Hortaea werneckii]OTA28775.1 hypothetical protein BTJ68_09863 [Hortaea werneckii EXF-2000]KAI6819541.1 hypothetical protein KC350_g10050 [Hortaea werneckii]KAI6904992.1 hypothetical protein KC348_g15124 [Hortaea werneckii]KAI6919723.1 hypothetical protein KC341_g17088 [Hortaea werneckii]